VRDGEANAIASTLENAAHMSDEAADKLRMSQLSAKALKLR
jgi:hypothetical protein